MMDRIIEESLHVDTVEGLFVWTKGHLDKQEFKQMVVSELGQELTEQPKDDEIHHTYLRYGMAGSNGEKRKFMFVYSGPGAGRFKATVFER